MPTPFNQALLCVRVLAVRVAPEHLTSLLPIAMSELQRIFLNVESTVPELLLAACQLIDTLLAAHPDDFSAFSWMFVPSPSSAHSTPPPAAEPYSSDPSAHRTVAAPASAAPSAAPSSVQLSATWPPSPSATTCQCGGHSQLAGAGGRHEGNGRARAPLRDFAALLSPLCAFASEQLSEEFVSEADGTSSTRALTGLLQPSADGRRRPLLGMRMLLHARDLAPFAEELHRHLAHSSLQRRAAELDVEMVRPRTSRTRLNLKGYGVACFLHLMVMRMRPYLISLCIHPLSVHTPLCFRWTCSSAASTSVCARRNSSFVCTSETA